MATTKYGKYLVKEPLREARLHTEVVAPILRVTTNEDFTGGADFMATFTCISQPFVMIKEAHSHDYDQVLFFIGGNIMDMGDFKGEAEVCLGEEEEKHIINSTTVLYIPKDLVHGPLKFTRVDEPLLFVSAFLGKDYTRNPVSN